MKKKDERVATAEQFPHYVINLTKEDLEFLKEGENSDISISLFNSDIHFTVRMAREDSK